ncbi:hypothetical protein [Sphingomonas soli]|uniref:hypothetical protein n=1 Tax=Sphingomonas soli TaxID=266127 RepID=UPI0008337FA6|nr:hypothetical protein [Sphingomonas soli]
MTGPIIPHQRIVVSASVAAILGYMVFSVWAVASGDPALKGDVIGTWKSFAVLAFGFWLGSSSGGKAKDTDTRPTGTPNDPVSVEPVQP